MRPLQDGFDLATGGRLAVLKSALDSLAARGRVQYTGDEHGQRPFVGHLIIGDSTRGGFRIAISCDTVITLCAPAPDDTTAFRLDAANQVEIAIKYIGGWMYYRFIKA